MGVTKKRSWAALAAIICLTGIAVAQSPIRQPSGEPPVCESYTREPIERSSCSRTLDLTAMRLVLRSMSLVPWSVEPKDSVPGHFAKGIHNGNPDAPIRWWWKTEIGVPYKWSGLDDDESFLSKHLDPTISAALHNSLDKRDQAHTAGIDCSGLASLAWGVGACTERDGKLRSFKRSTRDNDNSSLLAFAEEKDKLYDVDGKLLADWFKHIQPGDLLVLPSHRRDPKKGDVNRDGHVVIVSDINDNRAKVCVYDASGHRKVWDSKGNQTWLEWTVQQREVDEHFFPRLIKREDASYWRVWRWCGKITNLSRGGTSYNCEEEKRLTKSPDRLPDDLRRRPPSSQ